MAAISPEVSEFLKQWLEDDSGSDTIEWFLEHNLIDRQALKPFLLGIYNDHKDDPDMKEYALRAKRAADTL